MDPPGGMVAKSAGSHTAGVHLESQTCWLGEHSRRVCVRARNPDEKRREEKGRGCCVTIPAQSDFLTFPFSLSQASVRTLSKKKKKKILFSLLKVSEPVSLK